MVDHETTLGPVRLRTPLVAASGTVGSVTDFAKVGAMEAYGAAVAKSVSAEPWAGRPAPRMAPTELGMLNGIGIQNPGIDAWSDEVAKKLAKLDVPVWGSAVGHRADEFVRSAKGLQGAGVAAIEINLSCPNLDDGSMFALDADAAGQVVAEVSGAVGVPIGAKLSPNAEDIVTIASAVGEAGADWVVLTNTAWGFGIDLDTRKPLITGGVGGYSGPAMKPLALRCVWEVAQALPQLPILGCGGVVRGTDAIEYLMAGASAVAIGTVHFAEPRAARRILDEIDLWCEANGVLGVSELVGTAKPW
ncbi:MAG: dihydroorotate dehydrogenase [Acidimicrobiia bacterium]|nr:dihydroorotate dehydrogenase [Acidimicrobiia bacterium]